MGPTTCGGPTALRAERRPKHYRFDIDFDGARLRSPKCVGLTAVGWTPRRTLGILLRTGYTAMWFSQAHTRGAFLLAASLLVVGGARAAGTPSRHKHAATFQAEGKPDTAPTTSVEVINGSSRRVVTLRSDEAPAKAASARRRHPARRAKHRRHHQVATPPPLTAEILNGNQKETRVFRNESAASAPPKNLSPVVIGIASERAKTGQDNPVVVGISSAPDKTSAVLAKPVVIDVASSESHLENGSNSQPVVVGVASSGAQAAGVVEPVTVGVEPRPAKRAPYRPAKLDRQ